MERTFCAIHSIFSRSIVEKKMKYCTVWLHLVYKKQSYAFNRYFDYSCSLGHVCHCARAHTCINDYCRVLVDRRCGNLWFWSLKHITWKMKSENNKTWWIYVCINRWAQTHVFVCFFFIVSMYAHELHMCAQCTCVIICDVCLFRSLACSLSHQTNVNAHARHTLFASRSLLL